MKNLLITGALGGLGRPVTQYFSENGFQIFGTTSPNNGASYSQNIKYYPVNLFDELATEKFISDLRKETESLQAAILLVGGFAMNNLYNATVADYEEMFKLNFFTAINVIRPVHKWMTETGGGHLFIIGARPVFEGNSAHLLPYTISKSMLLQLTHSLNESSITDHVFTSLLVPGTIDTPANRKQMPQADFTKWTQSKEISNQIKEVLEGHNLSSRVPVVKFY